MPTDDLQAVVTGILSSRIFWYVVAAIFVGFFIKWALDKLNIMSEKKRLINGTILSENSYYKIGVPPEGFLTKIDKDRFTFEQHYPNGHIDFHHVPVELLTKVTITKSVPNHILTDKSKQMDGIRMTEGKPGDA